MWQSTVTCSWECLKLKGCSCKINLSFAKLVVLEEVWRILVSTKSKLKLCLIIPISFNGKLTMNTLKYDIYVMESLYFIYFKEITKVQSVVCVFSSVFIYISQHLY